MVEVSPVLRDVLEARGLYNDDLRSILPRRALWCIWRSFRRTSAGCSYPPTIFLLCITLGCRRPSRNIRTTPCPKTVNFPHDATKEEVAEVYTLAYKLGCKGVTIYRDGSREIQVLNLKKKEEPEAEAESCPSPIVPRPRPDVTHGLTEKVAIGCGNLYITVNYDENGICEVFTNTGKAGGCPSQSEATARLVSIALRSGMDVKTLTSQLRGIRCPSTIRQPGMKCTSCPDAIARVIEKVVASAEYQAGLKRPAAPAVTAPITAPARPKAEPAVAAHIRECPECGAPVEPRGRLRHVPQLRLFQVWMIP